MALGVGERQGRAPAAAQDQLPGVEVDGLAQRLDVGHQVRGGVVPQGALVVFADVGAALAGAALVQQHDAVAGRIEEATHPRRGAAARAAVQEQGRGGVGVAAQLVVELMAVSLEHRGVVRLDLWIQVHGVLAGWPGA